TSDPRELFPDGATRSWRPRGNEAVARGGRVAARHILDGDGDDDRIRRLLARASEGMFRNSASTVYQ
ncbi:unnamed protein product, partial [Urochloa humidicola]